MNLGFGENIPRLRILVIAVLAIKTGVRSCYAPKPSRPSSPLTTHEASQYPTVLPVLRDPSVLIRLLAPCSAEFSMGFSVHPFRFPSSPYPRKCQKIQHFTFTNLINVG